MIAGRYLREGELIQKGDLITQRLHGTTLAAPALAAPLNRIGTSVQPGEYVFRPEPKPQQPV